MRPVISCPFTPSFVNFSLSLQHYQHHSLDSRNIQLIQFYTDAEILNR